ncbi:tripartite tricarboxylate transporter substrate binding protein [Comamonas odontotermitis]|uniref:tripartite tricarboxylate transporter substrate binding protein n=1 Tax=Comamonas odontotermitis TaxID=379895 RepID=UPI00366FA2B3
MNIANQERRKLLTLLLGTAALPLGANAAEAALTKPLKIIVPFSAGALTDIIARIYAEKLSPLLGQPVIVENKPGAGGILASQTILAMPPDGHSLLFVSSAHAANPALRKKLPYDTLKDFSGVALLASSPCVIVVPTDHPAKDLEQLIRLGRERAGQLTYGSAGIASATHLAGAYFCTETKLQMVHVPFKGVQEAVTAVASGQLDVAFPPIALAQSMMAAGRIRVLAVTSAQRVSILPGTPTVAEKGYPGFDSSIWYALVEPSASPKPIITLLAHKTLQVSAMPAVAEKLRSQGLVQEKLILGDFDRFIADDMRKVAVLVRSSGIEPE